MVASGSNFSFRAFKERTRAVGGVGVSATRELELKIWDVQSLNYSEVDRVACLRQENVELPISGKARGKDKNLRRDGEHFI